MDQKVRVISGAFQTTWNHRYIYFWIYLWHDVILINSVPDIYTNVNLWQINFTRLHCKRIQDIEYKYSLSLFSHPIGTILFSRAHTHAALTHPLTHSRSTCHYIDSAESAAAATRVTHTHTITHISRDSALVVVARRRRGIAAVSDSARPHSTYTYLEVLERKC